MLEIMNPVLGLAIGSTTLASFAVGLYTLKILRDKEKYKGMPETRDHGLDKRDSPFS